MDWATLSACGPKPDPSVPVPRWVDLARERQARDLVDGPKRGLVFDEAEASKAVAFYRMQRQFQGVWAGKPLVLTPWQEWDLIRPVFGWKRADGSRRFRLIWAEIARKNGKSTLGAIAALYHLCADGEEGPEVYTAATKRDQAKIVLRMAQQMLRRSSYLRRRGVVEMRHSITFDRRAGVILPLGKDSDTLDGLNPHAAVCDEIHAWRDGELWDVIRSGQGARWQPIIWAITTAGANLTGFGWELHNYALSVLEGGLDAEQTDHVFAYITGIDKEDDWHDEACWIKANPNLGITISLDDLREQYNDAQSSPRRAALFRTKRLNVWEQSAERYLDLTRWDETAAPFDLDDLAGREIWLGLDLSSETDITALVAWVPSDDTDGDGDGEHFIFGHFWVPEEQIARRSQRDLVSYEGWVKDGHITATPGARVNYRAILDHIVKLGTRFKIREICYDPWNAGKLVDDLEAEGYVMVEVRQGVRSMAQPTKSLEGLVRNRQIRHGGNPVLRWMAANMIVRLDGNDNPMPDKKKSTERIDGIVAAIMAASRALILPEPENKPMSIPKDFEIATV